MSGLADAFPELIRAAEGPVLDTSCAALLRLAQAVHSQGYKVALTGEGADEALAGYVWYKVQAIRDGITGRIGHAGPRLLRKLFMGAVAGGRPLLPAGDGDRRHPARAAGPLRADLPGQADGLLGRHVAAARRSQPL